MAELRDAASVTEAEVLVARILNATSRLLPPAAAAAGGPTSAPRAGQRPAASEDHGDVTATGAGPRQLLVLVPNDPSDDGFSLQQRLEDLIAEGWSALEGRSTAPASAGRPGARRCHAARREGHVVQSCSRALPPVLSRIPVWRRRRLPEHHVGDGTRLVEELLPIMDDNQPASAEQ